MFTFYFFILEELILFYLDWRDICGMWHDWHLTTVQKQDVKVY